jgi:serine/threonine protein kinase
MSGILHLKGAAHGEGYTLVGPLADGATTLFEAHRNSHSESCVVRLFPEIGVGTEAARRMQTGVRAAAGLHHEGIGRLLDFNFDTPPVFVAMERIGGRSLEDAMATDGMFPLARATEIIGQIAVALEAAHAVGIFHDDLHPGAIRLTVDGRGRDTSKVLGFGWAREARLTGESRHQHALYRAPELQIAGHSGSGAHGHARANDAAADQFALAAIAYEMLAGCSYLSEESSDLADPEARRWRQPPRVADMVLGLPAGVDEVLRRALAYDPDRRFYSVRAFALALRKVADPGELMTPTVDLVPDIEIDEALAALAPRQPAGAATHTQTTTSTKSATLTGIPAMSGPPTPPPRGSFAPAPLVADRSGNRAPALGFLAMPVPQPVGIMGSEGSFAPALLIPKPTLSVRNQRLILTAGTAVVVVVAGLLISRMNRTPADIVPDAPARAEIKPPIRVEQLPPAAEPVASPPPVAVAEASKRPVVKKHAAGKHKSRKSQARARHAAARAKAAHQRAKR